MTLPPRILITGAGGFVGGYLRAALAARDPAPVVVGSGFASGANVEMALDIIDAAAVDAVVAREKPDVIVHLAGQASIGIAHTDAARTWAVNLGGTLNLALAVSRHAPEALVLFASSSEVYGTAFGVEPVDEAVGPQPCNAYAQSKLLAEGVLSQVLPASARLIVARPFNHTGPGQREDFVLPSFAGQVARIEAGLQPAVLRAGNLDAERDFLDVRDVVAAYVALLDAAPRLPPRFTCNIASGTARALRDVVETLRSLATVPFSVEIDPARVRPSDISHAVGRADRLAAATGWFPKWPFDDTLASLLVEARRRTAAPPRPESPSEKF